jgi:hypothetical protein
MHNLNQMLDTFWVRAAVGPLHAFTFRRGGGFAGRDVERILTESGIRVYERVRVGRDQLGFSVRRDQALWAEYLLCRARVPLTCDLLDEEHERLLHGDVQSHRSLLDRVLDALASFVS